MNLTEFNLIESQSWRVINNLCNGEIPFLRRKSQPAASIALRCVSRGERSDTVVMLCEADIYLSLSYTLYLRNLIIYRCITLPVV